VHLVLGRSKEVFADEDVHGNLNFSTELQAPFCTIIDVDDPDHVDP